VGMKKNKINKGADASIILELLLDIQNENLSESERKELVVKKYNSHFGKTSKETIKANVREDIVIKNQKNRFLSKLPQDLKKLDIIAAHLDENEDLIKITFSQQKGNNASFNSSSESKTLESISDCIHEGSYEIFFKLLPDHLNPLKCGKKYKVDVVIGMVNACGENIKLYNGIEIKYLSNDDYLLYLGLEIDIVELAFQIQNEEKIKLHNYDAVSECCNFDEIYNKCLSKIQK
jgi:hypothetical protein